MSSTVYCADTKTTLPAEDAIYYKEKNWKLHSYNNKWRFFMRPESHSFGVYVVPAKGGPLLASFFFNEQKTPEEVVKMLDTFVSFGNATKYEKPFIVEYRHTIVKREVFDLYLRGNVATKTPTDPDKQLISISSIPLIFNSGVMSITGDWYTEVFDALDVEKAKNRAKVAGEMLADKDHAECRESICVWLNFSVDMNAFYPETLSEQREADFVQWNDIVLK